MKATKEVETTQIAEGSLLLCKRCLEISIGDSTDKSGLKALKESKDLSYCKLCKTPMNSFTWISPTLCSIPPRTFICLKCAYLRNCCQYCLRDLDRGIFDKIYEKPSKDGAITALTIFSGSVNALRDIKKRASEIVGSSYSHINTDTNKEIYKGALNQTAIIDYKDLEQMVNSLKNRFEYTSTNQEQKDDTNIGLPESEDVIYKKVIGSLESYGVKGASDYIAKHFQISKRGQEPIPPTIVLLNLKEID